MTMTMTVLCLCLSQCRLVVHSFDSGYNVSYFLFSIQVKTGPTVFMDCLLFTSLQQVMPKKRTRTQR
jgi:hypothetical protein